MIKYISWETRTKSYDYITTAIAKSKNATICQLLYDHVKTNIIMHS